MITTTHDIVEVSPLTIEYLTEHALIYSEYLKNATTFQDGRKKADMHFKALAPNTIDVPYHVTDELLDINKFRWTNERPPLAWYATVLAARNYFSQLSPAVMISLAKACNYYGDFELAKEIAALAEKCYQKNDDHFFLQIRKQLAKAYKNDGDFDAARHKLRNTMGIFLHFDDKVCYAYLLMLYAKLCSDYQQRHGWHVEFHRIAKDRISNEKAPENWLEICEESYAKANYKNDKSDSEDVYKRILKEEMSENDSYVRRKGHLLEARIINYIDCNQCSRDALSNIEEWIIQAWELVGVSGRLGNIKAESVRVLTLLRLARKVELWRRSSLDIKQNQIDLIEELIAGEASRLTSRAVKVASKINDWRVVAALYYEKGLWIKYLLKHSDKPSNGEVLASLEYFLKAYNTLQVPKDTITRLYHPILMEISESYLNQRNWDSAAAYYKEAYRHCKELVKNLEFDENDLCLAIERCQDTGSANSEVEELCLCKHELQALSRALTTDYRLLIARLMRIGDLLNSLTIEQVAKTTAEIYSISWRSRHHTLISHLNRIKTSSSLDEAGIIIDNTKDLIDQWAKDEVEYIKPIRLDICRELNNAVESISNRYNVKEHTNIDVDNTYKTIQINFNLAAIHTLIDNIISNAYEAANRLNVYEWKVKFSIAVRSEYVEIIVMDNIGAFEQFQHVIDCLNKNADPPSNKGPCGGKGLKQTHDFVCNFGMHKQPWYLEKKGCWKILHIPIARQETY